MRANRIWLAIGIILIASAFYEGRLKPQSRPIYERALSLYRQDNYAQSLTQIERAYEIEPNSTAILVLMGWNQLKLGQYDQARENFSRALADLVLEDRDPVAVAAKGRSIDATSMVVPCHAVATVGDHIAWAHEVVGLMVD